ncbi:unnamed protein product, partial [Haemonchus placei]|uniref:Uncharacterized protein n=1 Tax=Haemonchus placei TaxID=6290 RepID=A0A0N4VVR5_HAEPC
QISRWNTCGSTIEANAKRRGQLSSERLTRKVSFPARNSVGTRGRCEFELGRRRAL